MRQELRDELVDRAIEMCQAHLESAPVGAPAGKTHRDLYEEGIDRMIATNAEVGCARWEAANVDNRMAISAAATAMNFGKQDMLYLLTVALDRLVTLGLQGHPVYKHQEGWNG